MKFDPPPSMPPRRRVSAPADATGRAELEAWVQRHRGKPAIAPSPSAGRLLEASVLRPLAKKFGPGTGELRLHWKEIVGEALARWTRPERIQSGAAGRTLVISARGPAAALIEAQSSRILDRVAQYAGSRPARLKVVQSRLAGPAAGSPRR